MQARFPHPGRLHPFTQNAGFTPAAWAVTSVPRTWFRHAPSSPPEIRHVAATKRPPRRANPADKTALPVPAQREGVSPSHEVVPLNNKGNNPQHQPEMGEPDNTPRQARQKASELAVSLRRLAQLSDYKLEWAWDNPDTSTVPALSRAAMPPRPGRPPSLRKHDVQAYQLSAFAGLKQSQIAAKLNVEHGTTYSQGQVSKMIRRVCVHTKATGLLRTAVPATTGRPVGRHLMGDVCLIDHHLHPLTSGRPPPGCRSGRLIVGIP